MLRIIFPAIRREDKSARQFRHISRRPGYDRQRSWRAARAEARAQDGGCRAARRTDRQCSCVRPFPAIEILRNEIFALAESTLPAVHRGGAAAGPRSNPRRLRTGGQISPKPRAGARPVRIFRGSGAIRREVNDIGILHDRGEIRSGRLAQVFDRGVLRQWRLAGEKSAAE